MSSLLPRVSVLLPVRNGMPWLPAALDSIWAQTFRDFELLAIEDGSSDGTASALGRQTDRRLRVLPTGGIGLARALNHGLAHARGALVARHDADDLSEPERFARQVAFLDAHRDIDVLATAAGYIGPAGEPIDDEWVRTVRRQQDVAVTPEQIARLMPITCCVTHGSVMARAVVLRGAGGYRDQFVPSDDYDLWLRLLPGHRFARLPEQLYHYRLHPAQLGGTNRERQTRNAIKAKLEWLRRVEPALPAGARLAAEGSARGNGFYAEAAAHAGFRMVRADEDWDVLALTDFVVLDTALDTWGRDGGVRLRGNLVVRDRVAAAAAAGVHA
jgi:glycosyltransferase involved in cell wall biosynthesis